MSTWQNVNFPLLPGDPLPAERKTVLVWLEDAHLPFCGYVRYAAGDVNSPYFVVYHGNPKIGTRVVAWCDCLPDTGPEVPTAGMYTCERNAGRGYPAMRAYQPESGAAGGVAEGEKPTHDDVPTVPR
jgi:hypothetical protein